MRYIIRVASAALAVLALACGSDSPTGPPQPTYPNIAGTYAGALAGISQGITLQTTFTITITQSAGALEGSYSLVGTLSDGVITVPVQGTGTLTGTIAAGNNPSVNFTATSGLCPNIRSVYSGAYDSVNAVITLNGTLNVFDLNTCQIVLTYPGTIILRR
jgi:hypothetical protein